jgi:hypothetical protein
MFKENVDFGDEERFGVRKFELFGELKLGCILVNGDGLTGRASCGCHLENNKRSKVSSI